MTARDKIEDEYRRRCADGVVEIIQGNLSVEAVRKEIWWWLKQLGVEAPWDSEGMEAGTVKRDLIELRLPVAAIQGCGYWTRGFHAGSLMSSPLLEIKPAKPEQLGWLHARWVEACVATGMPVAERMIAPKWHPIWTMLGDFGRPWQPFFRSDYWCGPWMKIVGFSEAVSLGWRKDDGWLDHVIDWRISCKEIAEEWRRDREFRIVADLPPVVPSLEELLAAPSPE